MTEEPEPGPDPQLRRLFCAMDECDAGERGAGQPQDAGDAAFTARVSALVRRRRRWRRIGAAAAVLIAAAGMAAAAAWAARLLARASIGLDHYGNDMLPQLGGWFATPGGWGCSLALAFLVIWRTRAFRR